MILFQIIRPENEHSKIIDKNDELIWNTRVFRATEKMQRIKSSNVLSVSKAIYNNMRSKSSNTFQLDTFQRLTFT